MLEKSKTECSVPFVRDPKQTTCYKLLRNEDSVDPSR